MNWKSAYEELQQSAAKISEAGGTHENTKCTPFRPCPEHRWAARWKRAAKRLWRDRKNLHEWNGGLAEESFQARMAGMRALLNEQAMLSNLTATQARCTELLIEVRRYRAALTEIAGCNNGEGHQAKVAKKALHEPSEP